MHIRWKGQQTKECKANVGLGGQRRDISYRFWYFHQLVRRVLFIFPNQFHFPFPLTKLRWLNYLPVKCLLGLIAICYNNRVRIVCLPPQSQTPEIINKRINYPIASETFMLCCFASTDDDYCEHCRQIVLLARHYWIARLKSIISLNCTAIKAQSVK